MIVRLFFFMCHPGSKKCSKRERTICWSAHKLRASCASWLKGAFTFFLVRQPSRSYGFRSADVREWTVAYVSAHAECKIIAAMCVLLKFRVHATHQTCLRPGWFQNAEQVSALVNIFSSMISPCLCSPMCLRFHGNLRLLQSPIIGTCRKVDSMYVPYTGMIVTTLIINR